MPLNDSQHAGIAGRNEIKGTNQIVFARLDFYICIYIKSGTEQMDKFSAHLDAKDVIEDYKKKAIKFPKAVNSTINQSASKAKTFISKEIRTRYNIKAGDFNKNFFIKRSTWQNLHAELTGKGTGLSIGHFGGKATPRPIVTAAGNKRIVVKARVIKAAGTKIIAGTFPMKSTFMKRTGTARLPIEKTYGPGLAYMFNMKVMNKADIYIISIFEPLLEKNIDFFYK